MAGGNSQTGNNPQQGGNEGENVNPQNPTNKPSSNEGNTQSSGGSNQGQTGNNTQTISSNNYLKSLQINVEGISPRFNRNTRQYYLIIQDNIENIEVNAIPEDLKSSVQITGNTNIQIGENRIVITVTAENGSTREYYINVTKTENIELANANLENLAIENVILIPEFNHDVTEYRVKLEENIQSLNILAVPQIENATVVITGNENLQLGENLISIVVTAVNGTTSKVYNIVAVKGNVETEVVDENNMQDNNSREAIENNKINIENTNKQNKQKSNIKLLLIIFAIVLLIGIIVIILLKKLKKNKEN